MEQVSICIHDYKGFCMFGKEYIFKKKKDNSDYKDCLRSACPERYPRFCGLKLTLLNCKFRKEKKIKK